MCGFSAARHRRSSRPSSPSISADRSGGSSSSARRGLKHISRIDWGRCLHSTAGRGGPMATVSAVRTSSPAYQAYQILHLAFTVAPIVAGADKFFHFLVDWDQYVSPLIPQTLHIAPHTFMLGVGVIEIIAGLLVAFMPMVGAWVVGAWLCGIILNL